MLNCIQKARLEIMHNNLRDLYAKMSAYKMNGDDDMALKYSIRIKMKKEQIKAYKEEIGL